MTEKLHSCGNRNQAKQLVGKLLEKYEKLEKAGKIKDYNEAQTRNEFIEPLFGALGWDMRNLDHENEVTTEENVSGGRVDLAFRLNNIPVMFLEAKAMKVDLDEWKWAEQAINYSWNKGVDWAVLTDFEGIKVFNATLPPKGPGENRYLALSYKDYLTDFEKLWQLSKESMQKGDLETEARKTGLLKERRSVDEVLFTDLMEWRQKLSNNFSAYNENVEHDLLDEGVQKLLDRLIFIRTAEDRKIEEKVLIVKLREWEKKGRKGSLMKVLDQVFDDFKATYDSKLFENHPFEKWEIEDSILEKVIKGLYESGEGYTYDFSAISADVLGGIYEQYLGHILEKAKKSAKVTEKHKKRKSQGIYYTPKFIVDYIVENTLGKKLKELKKNSKNLLRDVKKLKVLDPACGSGSFLIRAFEVLDQFYEKECGATGDPMARRMEILLNNIYGVDLDPQAIEIARLNLLLRALRGKGSLPSLEGNIKCGNSLVSGSEEELKKYFGENWREKKAFEWKEEFSEVFDEGGFDVVVGNPPYVNIANIDDSGERKYFQNKFKSVKNKTDLYAIFVERGSVLLAQNGVLGFIVPRTWLGTDSFSKFRKFIIGNTNISQLVKLPNDVFKSAVVVTVLLFLEKRIAKKNHCISIFEYLKGEFKKKNWSLNWGDVINTPDHTISFSPKINFKVSMVKLGEIASFSLGIKTSNDKKFILDHRKDSDTYKMLRGKDVCRYSLQWNKKWIWYKPSLMMKKVGAGPRRQEYFLKDKVLFRSISGGVIMATLDKDKFFTNDKVHILHEVSKDFSMKFILGLLNSKLMNYWIKSTFGDLLEIKMNQLEKIPIFKAENKDQKVIIKLVDEMLDLNKKLLKVEENSEEWKKLNSDIEKIDGKIDSAVFGLYGLTQKEIGIVEGGGE